MSSKFFDPNAAAPAQAGIFGLPHTESEASLVYIPVPWEVTTSYGSGTSQGPAAILRASHQVDLYDSEVLRPYEPGLCMLSEENTIRSWNQEGKKLAQKIIQSQDENIEKSADLRQALQRVNELSEQLNQTVYRMTQSLLEKNKIVGIVGGDHSVPFGGMQALAEKTPFGILHFDAHSDTRKAYEGFTWSHASIMYNVMERIPNVTRLVQVGIRDFCEAEMDYTLQNKERIISFLDQDLSILKFEGRSWQQIANEIVAPLPQQVWVSFDIDGLDPQLCPHTGTPVPGGLSFREATYILSSLVRSGRQIIGFDLNEVAPHPQGLDEWDANVGARLLYKLSALTLVSQGKAQFML